MALESKFLIIRRDNIGDLVCTTPIFSALRKKFPASSIAALVNSYNAEVLHRNPNLDTLYAYTKAKHRGAQSLVKVHWLRVKLLIRLRRQRFDYVIIAGQATKEVLRTARFLRPSYLIRFASDSPTNTGEIAVQPSSGPIHEAVDMLRLLEPLGIYDADPRPTVYPDPTAVRLARQAILPQAGQANGQLVGVHISSRKISQRWPTSYFAELLNTLHKQNSTTFVLLWSPGRASDVRHPGDDEKARDLANILGNVSVVAFPTPELRFLVAALSLCDHVICSDGGAMHIAAALKKPIVCLFGRSNSRRWHPLGAPYRLLQPASLDAKDISPAEVIAAYTELTRARDAVISAGRD